MIMQEFKTSIMPPQVPYSLLQNGHAGAATPVPPICHSAHNCSHRLCLSLVRCEYRHGPVPVATFTPPFTVAPQLHANLDALATTRPHLVFNVVYLPRILFPCSVSASVSPTPCMLTAEVSRALKGVGLRPPHALPGEFHCFTLVFGRRRFCLPAESRARNSRHKPRENCALLL